MRAVVVTVLVALLAGCATLPRPVVRHPHRLWVAHRARMAAIQSFEVSAESGVVAGRHGGTLMLRWIVKRAAYQMTGLGPFGRVIFRLRADPAGARLRTERGRFQGASPSRLLWRLTGLRLPVSGLRFWILGIPAPGPVTRHRLDRRGLLASLTQAGWAIRYRSYRRTARGRLPRFLTLTHAGTSEPSRIVVKIRIDRWRIT